MNKIKGIELVDKEFEVLEDGTLRLVEEKTKKFIPKVSEEYWFLSNMGGVLLSQNDGSSDDCWLINHQLVFKTAEECSEYKKFLKLLDRYKCELDWKDENESKYYLYYDKSKECIGLYANSTCQTQGAFYFKSQEDVKDFVDRAGEDAVKKYMFDVWEE